MYRVQSGIEYLMAIAWKIKYEKKHCSPKSLEYLDISPVSVPIHSALHAIVLLIQCKVARAKERA